MKSISTYEYVRIPFTHWGPQWLILDTACELFYICIWDITQWKWNQHLVKSPAVSHKPCKSVQCHWSWCSDSFRSGWTKQILSEITKQHHGSSFPRRVEMHCGSSRLAHGSWLQQHGQRPVCNSASLLCPLILEEFFSQSINTASHAKVPLDRKHTSAPPVSQKLWGFFFFNRFKQIQTDVWLQLFHCTSSTNPWQITFWNLKLRTQPTDWMCWASSCSVIVSVKITPHDTKTFKD